MKVRWPHLTAALSVVALLTWLGLAGSRGRSGGDATPAEPSDVTLSRPTTSTGSAVACAIPLRWRIGRIDPGAGVGPEEARSAVRRAAELWERAAGRSLFLHDPDRGLPVHFHAGEGPARMAEGREAMASLEARGRELARRRGELDSLAARLERRRAELGEDLDDFRGRVEGHNMEARSWSERSGVPDVEARELEETGRRLEGERHDLERRGRALEKIGERLRTRRRELRRRIREHRRRIDSLEAALPLRAFESGRYREAVRHEPGEARVVAREIRVQRFDGAGDLRRVLAHELGHALGLGHAADAADEGALMSSAYDRTMRSGDDPTVTPADRELLRRACARPAGGSAPP